MQLLLILSAMLSALTGAFGSARAPVAIQASSVAAASEARVAVAPRPVATIVTAQAAPVGVRVMALATLVLRPALPLYAGRQRE